MSYRTLIVATVAWLFASACPTIAVAALQTYRFAPGAERAFRYVGGLRGGGFDARLEGTFDVERVNDGPPIILRFDVTIADPLFHGSPPFLGDPTGMLLSDYMIQNPVGLPISEFMTGASAGETPDTSTYPRTVVSLSDWNSPAAQFRLYSGFNVLLDAPAAFTREGGATVVEVPEPASLYILRGAIVMLIAAWRRRGSLAPYRNG